MRKSFPREARGTKDRDNGKHHLLDRQRQPERDLALAVLAHSLVQRRDVHPKTRGNPYLPSQANPGGARKRIEQDSKT